MEGAGTTMSAIRTTSRASLRSWLLAAAAGVLGLIALFVTTASANTGVAAKTRDASKPTIVLVHGAFADASGWSSVIKRLQDEGYPVIAPANPLRSLSGDAAYIASVLAQTPGPLVVVGHSYGGAVITNAAAGNRNVKALVYIDAFIPDVGEDTLHLLGAGSLLTTSLEFKGFPPFGANDVDIYLRKDRFREAFCADVPAKTAAVMWASQRPSAAATGAELTTAAAWKTIPSWALIGRQDRSITPDALRFMAKRAGATTEEINASHVAMISHPGAVTDLIEEAADDTA
jgi:pimeloyl-ACP methyl ester carboxylesterase